MAVCREGARLLTTTRLLLDSDQERGAIISTLANAGGSENTNWLLALARSATETAGRRRQAVNALSRNDDPRVREALQGLIEH